MTHLRTITRVCVLLIVATGLTASYNYWDWKIHPLVEQVQAQLKSYANENGEEKVYLHFDKTLYKPGETIWYSAYCRAANKLTTDNISDILYIEFLDPKGSTIKKERVEMRAGNFGGAFDITADKPGGMYKIKAWTSWMKNEAAVFERDILIQKSVLPILNMKLEFEQKGYGAGEEVLAHLKLENLENRPLSGYEFDVKIKLEGKEYKTVKGKTDQRGKYDLTFKLPAHLNSNDGLVNFLIPFRGQTESISRSIPIALNDIDLQFFPEGGDLIENLKTKVAFKALNEFGKPTDVAGIVIDEMGTKVGSFESYHDGMGTFSLKPKNNKKYAVKIEKPKGVHKTYPLPQSKANGVILNVMNQDKNGANLQVKSSENKEYHLVVQSGEDILFSETFTTDKRENIYIPTSYFPLGISRVTLFDELKVPQCERLIFCNSHKQLNIEVTTNKEKYLPREKVDMNIKVTDEKGKPVKGQFSIAVADESLLTFSDDKQGHILSSILLESELKGDIEEPNFYFEKEEEALSQKDKSKALDLLMMTQGWRRFEWKEILKNEMPFVNFQKERAVIAGVVLDKDGSPVADAKIQILNHGQEAISNQDGTFEIKNFRFSQMGIPIKISKKGHPTFRHICNDYNDNMVIVLDDQFSILKGKITSKIPPNHSIEVSLKNQFDFEWKTALSRKGNYSFENILPGYYDMEIKVDGKTNTAVNGIWINGGNTIELDKTIFEVNSENKEIAVTTFAKEIRAGNFKFKKAAEIPGPNMDDAVAFSDNLNFEQFGGSGINLDEVSVVAYKVPLINKDKTTQGGIVTAEQIRNLPTKNINALAAQTAGVSYNEKTGEVNIKGSRSSSTEYYVDGIRVSGNMIPAMDIAEIEIMTGGIEAQFGGGMFAVEEEMEMADWSDGKVIRKKRELGAPGAPPTPAANRAMISTAGSRVANRNITKEYRAPKIYADVDELPYLRTIDFSKDDSMEEKYDGSITAVMDNVYDALLTYRYANRSANLSAQLELVIDKQGRIQQIEVKDAESFYHLISAYHLKRTLQSSSWSPAIRKGKTVASKHTFHIDIPPFGMMDRKEVTRARKFYAPKYHNRTKTRQRQDFRSTIHWAPTVVTNMNGVAKLSFYNSDDLNTFRITVEGFGNAGQVGRAEHKYFTQLPVSMDAKIPNAVLTGDEIKIPVMLTNNRDKEYKGKLTVPTMPTHFKAIDPAVLEVKLAAKESKTIYLRYKVQNTKNIARAPLQINLEGADIQDNIASTIETAYAGIPVNQVFSARELKNEFEFEINNLINNSMTANFYAHPSMLSELMNSLAKMIRQPSGCFEQTSSSNYPNVMAMQMIIENGNVNAALHKKSSMYLESGYKRLTGYEVQGGGFEWFGNPPAHEALTAFGLMQFVDMKKVYPVSDELIDRTAKWILSRKKGDGSWKFGKKGLHSWKENSAIRDAYICWSLTEAGKASSIKKEITKSYNDAMKSKDPYVVALVANIMLNTNDTRKNEVLKILKSKQAEDGSWTGATTSVTNSRKRNLSVETTGLAVLAFAKSKVEETALLKGVKYLSTQKSAYGYGSTQATVLALKGIVAYSKTQNQNVSDGVIKMVINGTELPVEKYSAKQLKAIQIKELQQYLHEGKNKVSISFEDTKQSIPFDLNVDYVQSMPTAYEEAVVDIKTTFATTKNKMGETVRLSTEVINTTDEAIPNTLAIVGIPAGLSLQPWQLREIMDKALVDFYEIFDGKIVFHWTAMDANETKTINLDLKADFLGTFTAPASSAYLYYDNDAVSWSSGEKIDVSSE